jgi:Putative zinc-finger
MMRNLNCKRAAQMIPLYVGRDLGDVPEREVAAHLATCDQCRRLAEEYSESSSLVAQACTPPEFGEEFYSGIRSAVLEKISRDRLRSTPSLFHRRWVYATAFAAIVVIAGVALQYFRGTRQQPQQSVAAVPQGTGQSILGGKEGAGPAPMPPKSVLLPSPRKSRGVPQHPAVQLQKVIAPIPQSAANASTGVTTARLEVATNSPGSPTSSGRAASSPVSRIEIQTADPNIRIIWLTPQESRESEEIKHDQDQQGNGHRN